MADHTFPADKQPAIRVSPMPADTNAIGDIFGGWLMSQVDIAGSIAAYRCAHGRVVTVAVNSFQFIKPVFVGDLVSIYSEVIKIGNTSIQVAVDAFAERRHSFLDETETRADEYNAVKVAEAVLTYVAIDKNLKPRPVNADCPD
ncbi:MAG: acyl-CoA thioesterase [Gammaproteobacteria bacterium]|nr:acyl-CoA thioesterase [Gammaproteobacteria bacterium]MDH5652691.1 acyl-CoA thioesterase [Gammaproteobacteria bacterium]